MDLYFEDIAFQRDTASFLTTLENAWESFERRGCRLTKAEHLVASSETPESEIQTLITLKSYAFSSLTLEKAVFGKQCPEAWNLFVNIENNQPFLPFKR